MDLHEQLDNWKAVRYRMKAEGIEYCFRHYSSFQEIEDSYFHTERTLLLHHMKNLEDHVNDMIEELESNIEEDEDDFTKLREQLRSEQTQETRNELNRLHKKYNDEDELDKN